MNATLTAEQALEALRSLGCAYTADARQPDGLWLAVCPACRLYSEKPTLSICEQGRGRPVTLSCRTGCDSASIIPQLCAALSPRAWPVLGAADLPPFPVAALPRSIADWVGAVAEETQTPPDLAAMAALGVLSAAAMGGAVVDCGNWTEELALYLLVAMPSGDRKSTVLRAATEPLRQIEKDLRDAAAQRVRELRARSDVLDVRVRKLTKVAGEASDVDARAAAAAELETVIEERDEIGEPVLPRLLADDATPEALAGLLAHHPAIAVVAAESALLDNLSGRYSDGGANLHLVCGAYGGEATTIDRRGRDPEVLDRPLLAIVLAVQPHVLEALASNDTARAQGLVARFACVIPETRLGHREIDAPKASAAVHAGWAATVCRVNSVCSVSVSQDVRITFNHAATAIFRALRAEHELRLADDGDLRPVADWAARHPGRIARIAGLLHLAADHDANEPIGEATMRDAVRIGDYLLAHGLAILTGPDDQMRRALRWMAGRETITLRDLQRGPLGGRGKADDAAELAERLVQYGALRAVPVAHKGPGRPPSPTYEVNPNTSMSADKTDRITQRLTCYTADNADRTDRNSGEGHVRLNVLPADCEVVA